VHLGIRLEALMVKRMTFSEFYLRCRVGDRPPVAMLRTLRAKEAAVMARKKCSEWAVSVAEESSGLDTLYSTWSTIPMRKDV
jgi:hypothetical protein